MAQPIDVVAYARPNGNSTKANYYFDGTQWFSIGSFDTNLTWEQFSMVISTDNVVVDTSIASSPYTIARAYKGNFDRISVYENGYNNTYWAAIDDISLTGGNIVAVPEPASVALLGLGFMFLRRRSA